MPFYYPVLSAKLSAKKTAGFSIIELLIVLVLALFIIAGAFTIFVDSRGLTEDTIVASDRYSNGSFALQVLTRDLKQSYFFAEASGNNNVSWINTPIISNGSDCLDNIGSRSFPFADKYRPLWSSTIPASLSNLKMSCLNDSDINTDLVVGSDYISVKRIRGLEQTNNYVNTRYYLDINIADITVYDGTSSVLTSGSVNNVWEYIHHVYYLDQADGLYRLRRLSLQKDKMIRDAILATGVENMQFMFALDELSLIDRDGGAHSFVSTDQVTDSDWNNGRVVGMKIFLLVRSDKEINGYVNSQQYQLGDYTYTAPNDSYKRNVLSQVVMFSNKLRNSNG